MASGFSNFYSVGLVGFISNWGDDYNLFKDNYSFGEFCSIIFDKSGSIIDYPSK